MKALSLWQPWASLVAAKVKNYETRSWAPPKSLIGQRIAICAAKTTKGFAVAGPELEALVFKRLHRYFDSLPTGVIVATAVVFGIAKSEAAREFHKYRGNFDELACGDYADNRWAWVLADIMPVFGVVPVKGMQGIFTLPEETSQALHKAGHPRPGPTEKGRM